MSDVNECLSSPCGNGATCNNRENAYECQCALGWQGVNCLEGKYTTCTVKVFALLPNALKVDCCSQLGSKIVWQPAKRCPAER